jgi:hypothetical protein
VKVYDHQGVTVYDPETDEDLRTLDAMRVVGLLTPDEPGPDS